MTFTSSNKLSAFVLALLTLTALVIPLLQPAEANHPSGTCLDLTPESDENPQGETHEVTATLRVRDLTNATADNACEGDPKSPDNGPVNIDFRIEGANDPNPENTSGTADYSCDIAEGDVTASCSFVYTGTQLGEDLIRGWVDHDKVQSTIEADQAEGVNDIEEPGTGDQCSFPAKPAEPDCTDVVEKTWVPGAAAAVDCDDPGLPDTEREFNPSNEGSASNETYTCTVTDARGNPVGSGETVYGEVENGVNDPDATDGPSYTSPDYGCTTGSNSTCTITVTQNEGETGTAEICFWTGTAAEGGDAAHCGNEPTGENQLSDGSDAPNDEADQVEKTWEERRASAVDAEPESDTNSPGENHTITATVYDQFGSTFTGNTKIDFEFFQGSPSDTDGNTPGSPDRSCTTPESNTCSITYTSQQSGLDLICVYPDSSQPSMSGSNSDGSCDGETLADADDDTSGPDAPTRDSQGRVSDDQDVVQKRWAAPGEATRLDCTPETASNPTGTSHTVTCTARNQQDNVVGGVNVDAEATGANDPDGNSDSTSPDFSCTTDDNGTCSFTHGSGGSGTTNEQGTTTYRAWIDSDNNNATTEADPTESRDETTSAGAGSEGDPDNTDVVQKTWTGDARRIDCEPETANNATGTSHTVTCTVTDRSGSAVRGEGVQFTETGPGDIEGSNTDTTDENGQATVTTTSNEPGEQSITGTLADDTNAAEPDEEDECDRVANDPQGAPAGECSDTVTKTWQEPPPAADCSDGIDNDGDGNTDYPDDTGCSSASDESETGATVTSGPCAGYAQSSSTPRSGGGRVIVGTDGPDDLRGTAGSDLICALGGRDTVRGAGGGDTIYGGGGHDDIRGNAGGDTLYGQAGLDVMRGGHGSDTVRGGAQDDTMRGFTGNDRMVGGGGNDTLRGGEDRDVLRGNKGDDLLDGGGGVDRCRGGNGKDRSFRCER